MGRFLSLIVRACLFSLVVNASLFAESPPEFEIRYYQIKFGQRYLVVFYPEGSGYMLERRPEESGAYKVTPVKAELVQSLRYEAVKKHGRIEFLSHETNDLDEVNQIRRVYSADLLDTLDFRIDLETHPDRLQPFLRRGALEMSVFEYASHRASEHWLHRYQYRISGEKVGIGWALTLPVALSLVLCPLAIIGMICL